MDGNIAANSLEEHWLPFTGNRDFKESPRLTTAASGMYLTDHKGGRVIDGCSALFCTPAGHARKEIADAVHRALSTMDYIPSFQISHPASFALARKVSSLLPEPMNHVFFTNSGSESVETALKIVMAYHRARGDGPRSRWISRERAYHGVNIGGVSLSGLVNNRRAFPAVMPNVVMMRHTWTGRELFVRGQPEQDGVDLANDLARACATYGGETISAVFVEPVAGSTGVLVPPKGYLERIREICDEHGILLVFDEVITGFGRTGKPFASETFGVTPDIITMAKALTNGCIPMGAVGVRDEIYETVANAAPKDAIEFFHGYTYSAHPAACAAGLAALEIYDREGLFEKAAALSDYFLDAVFSLKGHPMVKDIRGIGLLAGVELHPRGAPGALGQEMQKRLFWNGCHIKFTGDNVIPSPAFIAERSHIDEIVDKLKKTLDEA
jgi:beta-alanine--pyruvate transaminase